MLKAIAQGALTRDKILDAAFETLRTNGFAGTSARAVARTGGFNQALIFYHFGSVNDLLLAALDRISDRRLIHYREALNAEASAVELAKTVRYLYREDVESGHSTVLAELLVASSSNPALRVQMLNRIHPWSEFTESMIRRFFGKTPLAALIDSHAIAGAVLAMYIGVDLLIHLEGDDSRADAIFDAGDRLAAVLGQVFE